MIYMNIARKTLVYALAIIILVSSSTLALPPKEKEAIDKDNLHALIDEGINSSGTCEGSVVLTGKNNGAKAVNFLIGKGLDPHQAAGIAGNLMAESTIIPNRKQGGPGIQTIDTIQPIKDDIANGDPPAGTSIGFGIAQWTSSGRQKAWLNYAETQKMDALSLELELMYLWHELETNTHYGLKEIKAAPDLRQAAWVFLVFFERPAATTGYEENPTQASGGSAKAELDTREGLAKQFMSAGDGSASGASTDSCTPGNIVDDVSEPDYKANPKVSIDDGPTHAFDPADCTGGLTVGADSLGKYTMKKWSPPVTSVGGYACRKNTNADTISIHGLGRALDIMVDAHTPAGLETGDNIRNFMINNSTVLGVQRVIWNGHIWGADQDGWRAYDGPDDHTSHVHVEVNEKAAANPNLAGAL
jgi:hypothetical protein